MNSDIFHSSFHISVVRRFLTWNLRLCFPDVNGEIKAAFEDLVPATNGMHLTTFKLSVCFVDVMKTRPQFLDGNLLSRLCLEPVIDSSCLTWF